MDLNSLSFLGPAGYTLSIEEKASLEVNFIQRSREVSPRGADVHRARCTRAVLRCTTGRNEAGARGESFAVLSVIPGGSPPRLAAGPLK